MSFTPINREHVQSIWEQKVAIDLTESGVHSIRLTHLVGGIWL